MAVSIFPVQIKLKWCLFLSFTEFCAGLDADNHLLSELEARLKWQCRWSRKWGGVPWWWTWACRAIKLLLNANSFTQSAHGHETYKAEQYGVCCALFGKEWLGKDLAMLWKKGWSWQQKGSGCIEIGLMSMSRMRILVLFYRTVDTVVTRLCIVQTSRKSNNINIKTLYWSRDRQNKDHYPETENRRVGNRKT